MITREELTERAARAVFDVRVRGISFERSLAAIAITEDARTVIRIALASAADIADEYAIAQPSFDPKQIAAYEIADDIRSLIPEDDNA